MRMMHRVGALSYAKDVKPYYELSYTGNHTVEEVVHAGMLWEQLTLLTSGILNVVPREPIKCQVCVIGGGTGGFGTGNGSNQARGGGGGFLAQNLDWTLADSTVVTIGAGGNGGTVSVIMPGNGGATSFGGFTANGGNGMNGGSGGGGAANGGVGGTGDGGNKHPYGDAVNFADRPHCPGGGGGEWITGAITYTGGRGGSNGSNGTTGNTLPEYARQGGLFGGGNGGTSGVNGTPGTFYGAGGGGGCQHSTGANRSGGGNGYQGVVYLRIPLGRAA